MSVVRAADAELSTQAEIAEAAGFSGSDQVVELAELVPYSAADVCQIVVVRMFPVLPRIFWLNELASGSVATSHVDAPNMKFRL